MIKRFVLLFLLTATARYLPAQDTAAVEAGSDTTATSTENGSDAVVPIEPEPLENVSDASPVAPPEAPASKERPGSASVDDKSLMSKVQWGATVDMQVDKEMWDEFNSELKNRLSHESLQASYRQVADDFWMRVALRGMYRTKNVESAFALRFYPYWTMRRKGAFYNGKDLALYLDVLEINQAYLKIFKDYAMGTGRYSLHLKLGRDGLLSTGSQLFGNYLEIPTAGYGEGRVATVTGPFKNRKIFANMLEAGFSFNAGEVIGGKTSLMIGGNVNNQKWYTAPTPQISETFDSKLISGFTRGYQDLYFLNERIHLGAGVRVYTTKVSKEEPVVRMSDAGLPETTSTRFTTDSRYINGDWTFDVTILPDCKFYSEFGYQKLGVGSATGVIRPFTAGITIPTGGVLDVLALEIENVANTFFSDKSMRDPVGNRKNTNSFAWGIVAEKMFLDERVGVAWGVYTGDAYGDMKTSLRLTSNFK